MKAVYNPFHREIHALIRIQKRMGGETATRLLSDANRCGASLVETLVTSGNIYFYL